MTNSISAAGSAAMGLMSLNNVTSQMTDAQNQISSGKAVNGYADNPATFYTATLLTNQQTALKQNASILNSNLNTINNAMGAITTVQSALTKIRSALTEMSDPTSTAAVRTVDAQTVANEATALNSAIGDDITAAAATGRQSLLDSANNGMTVNLGSGGTMTVTGANLAIPPTTTRATTATGLGISLQDIATLANLARTGAGAATTTTTAPAAAGAVAGPAVTTTTATQSVTVQTGYADSKGSFTDANGNPYTASSGTSANPVSLQTVTTTTTTGLVTAAANMMTAVTNGLNNANAVGKNLGAAADAINTVLSNNTALQTSLGSEISSLVDADVAAEQVKLSALTVQQQLSVSALSSIASSRQNLLSLFR